MTPALQDAPETADYVLSLFVSGASTSSARAIRHVQAICEEYLQGRHRLTVINVHTEPALARAHRVQATPTLLRERPLPQSRMVGDFSDHPLVLRTLGIPVFERPREGVEADHD
jgi:circadian clock protein KaiB